MWVKRLRTFGLIIVVLAFLGIATGATAGPAASPLAGPCAPGAAYDPACDVDHDGDVDIFDIQLSAGHWNQTGTWLSDNDHNHLGQTWTGNNNPLRIEGSFGTGGDAALNLSNSAVGGHGLRIDTTNGDGVYVNAPGDDGVFVFRAGDPSSYSTVVSKNGFDVAGAEGYGLFVGRADFDGVRVNSAGRDGVDATSNGASYFGGNFENAAIGGGGVYARGGGNAAPDLILGGQTDSTDDGRIYSEPSLTGSDILLFSNDRVHVHLDDDDNTAGSNFIIFGGDDASLWSVSETGMAVAAGPSAVQVDAGQQGKRLAYAMTSPQNWVEDFGSGQLQDGEAVVALETGYAEAVSAEQPYHVFLTPLGDCALYVAEKAAASFTVRALGGEQCSVAFDYRIVGLRRGYETERMERYVEVSDE